MNPSIKTLMSGLNVTKEQAQIIRERMKSNKGALAYYNRISTGFGIEVIGLPEGCFDNCQTPDVTIVYVNKGDSYDTTLMKVNGQYKVGNWGDIVGKYS